MMITLRGYSSILANLNCTIKVHNASYVITKGKYNALRRSCCGCSMQPCPLTAKSWKHCSNRTNIPIFMVRLRHLKYLEVCSFLGRPDNVSPSSVTELVYLETFFVFTSKATDMPDDIWNMVRLRHLYNEDKSGKFYFKACPSQGAKTSSVLPSLQTLHTLCACKSCLTNLVRFPNLKKLGLEGDLISECGYPTIPDLGFLEQLVTLKVTNTNGSLDPWSTPDRSSALFKLKLPASIRKLTLQYTFLKWEEISVLAELENLEVLKLLDRACEDTEAGSGWDTSDLEFPKLKYLKLQSVNIKKWDDSDLQFESLEILALVRCWALESIPFDLALSPSLHTIEVTRCETSLEMIAKEIAAEYERQCGNRDLQVFIKSA